MVFSTHILVDPNHWSEGMDESTLLCLVQAHNCAIEERDCGDSVMLQTRISSVLQYLGRWNMRHNLFEANLDFSSGLSSRYFKFRLYERILQSTRGERKIIYAYDSRLDHRVNSSADLESGAELLLNMASCSYIPKAFMADYMRFHLEFHPFNIDSERLDRYDRLLTILVMEIKILLLVIGKHESDCFLKSRIKTESVLLAEAKLAPALNQGRSK